MSGWRLSTGRVAYGGDYNPEQWPEETWLEDVRLMREAGVNLVTVGVFSWATLQPEPETYDFGWLDRILDLLHANDVRVDLATATASPPPWFSRRHPESLPVTREGTTLWPGGRQAYCPSSGAYREAATKLVHRLATRYAEHPALELWHVNNEYGCHVSACYCDVSAAAFRAWLRDRYTTLDALNDAWGTAFWSQRYYDWEEIHPPRAAPTFPNPSQQLDFARFSSDELLECYRAELAVLRRVTPDVPVTTNFMTPSFKPVDYFAWAPDVDVVSTDHYLRPHEGDANLDLALSGDLTRGLAGGRPWLLMEHSTSAVNWQPVNLAKAPGELRRNSLAHLARGSNGALFFQWRASQRGAEKFHSGLVPHAGTDTRLWREVVALGEELEGLSAVLDQPVHAEVALVWDYESWWAVELDSHPSDQVSYLDRVRAFHGVLWQAGVTVDVAAPGADLSAYKLVLVPSLYLVRDPDFLDDYDGHVVISYFSGIVDANDGVLLGGYPGAFRERLGIRVEEFRPFVGERRVGEFTATVWSEDVRLEGAEALLRFDDGTPAVTRHGDAWYLATRLDEAGTTHVLRWAWQAAGVQPLLPELPLGVERVRRGDHVFVFNHTAEAVDVPGHGPLEAGGAAVIAPAR
ncbi:beta-galactosidase [Solirubrobacter phytolaccae]|uniref:Beta-galactosidase n=1 Tax=Solirubrobacter phytolaccae TaxID=1404360 RepID=A0A9X3NBY2_9ACTN|nr:beta-galactosidase [Solirubrobacter phytolaccae]MDA0183121.1 beta-galactosidase [Solirubrobacter phytolaccae]